MEKIKRYLNRVKSGVSWMSVPWPRMIAISSMKEKYVDVNAVVSRRIKFEGIDNAFSSNIEPRIASLKGYGTFLQNVFTSDSFRTIANVSVLISCQHDFPRWVRISFILIVLVILTRYDCTGTTWRIELKRRKQRSIYIPDYYLLELSESD